MAAFVMAAPLPARIAWITYAMHRVVGCCMGRSDKKLRHQHFEWFSMRYHNNRMARHSTNSFVVLFRFHQKIITVMAIEISLIFAIAWYFRENDGQRLWIKLPQNEQSDRENVLRIVSSLNVHGVSILVSHIRQHFVSHVRLQLLLISTIYVNVIRCRRLVNIHPAICCSVLCSPSEMFIRKMFDIIFIHDEKLITKVLASNFLFLWLLSSEHAFSVAQNV